MSNMTTNFIIILAMLAVAASNVCGQSDEAGSRVEEPPVVQESVVVPTGQSSAPSGLGGMGLAGPGGGNGAPGYSITWMPAQQVQGQPTNLEIVQQSFNAGFPLYRQDGNMLLLTTRVQSTLLLGQVVLPDSQRTLSEDFWNISLGTMFIKQLDSGSSIGAMASLGSASDRPFNQLRDYSPMLIAFYRLPVREHDAWMFSLMYSPVGEINFPIPGVSYQYQPSDNFRMNIGVPFSLMYRPCEDVTFDISYMLLRTVNAQVTWKWSDCWSIYGRYAWGSQSWFLAERTEDRERLFMYDMRLLGGLKCALTDKLNLDVSVGYVFDRFFFTGTNSNDMQHDRVDVSPGLVTTLSLQWRF